MLAERADHLDELVEHLGVVRELRLAGTAVLVSTHLLELAVQACEEAVVLHRGAVVAACPAAELTGHDGAVRYRALLR